MNRKIKMLMKICTVAFVWLIFLRNFSSEMFAAEAKVSVSNGTTEVGKETEIVITVSYTEAIGSYQIYINYDASIIKYVAGEAGGGSGKLTIAGFAPEANTVTHTLKFKGKVAGTSNITVNTTDSIFTDMEENHKTIAVTNGKVTVQAAVTASSNNNLKSLSVVGVRADGSTAKYNITARGAEGPGFVNSSTQYTAYVANDIVKFAVTAVPEDDKATVAVSGLDLAEGGKNSTLIVVTAEDGSKKTYEINTYRVPSQNEDDTNDESESQPESESESESETPAGTDIEVTIGNEKYIVKSIDESMVIPEGFETFEYTYQGQTFIAAKGLAKNIIVMQLSKPDGGESALFVYDESKNIFYKFFNIQITNKMYTLKEKPDEVSIPDGFKEATLTLENGAVAVWVDENDPEMYMIYAMNWNGEEGLYLYDAKEKAVLRYNGSLVGGENNDSIQADNKTEEPKVNGNEYELIKTIIIIVEACLIVIFLIIVFLMLRKKMGDDPDDYDDYYYDDDDTILDDEETVDDTEIEEDIEVEEDTETEEDRENQEDTETEEDRENQEEAENIEDIETTEIAEAAGDSEDIKVLDNESEPVSVEEETIEEAETEDIKDDFKENMEASEELSSLNVAAELNLANEIEEMMTETTEEGNNLEENKETKETKEEIVEKENFEEEKSEEEKLKEKSIDEILSDSSTSLNDEELDLVLDKLLGDE